jgi:nucleotide-binding universal stress UspA family protein
MPNPPTEIRKIMFATDFSGTSNNAQETAIYLRNKMGCALHVVHVYDPSAFDMPMPYGAVTGVEQWLNDHFNGMRERGRSALADLCPDLGECNSHFLEGKPGPKLVAFAEEQEIDLIVMGTHGHRGLDRLVMGSVAEYVLRHAPCPVLTVKCPTH